jgi:hypothetical protein
MNNEIELENMREQMNTLKKKLDKQEIINDNLIRQSLKRNTNSINRRYTVCSIVSLLLIPYGYWAFVKLNGSSLGVWISLSILMLVVFGYTLYTGRFLRNKNMYNHNLIEASQKVAKAKKLDKDWLMFGIPAGILWFGYFIFDTYMKNPDNNFLFFAITMCVCAILGGFIGLKIHDRNQENYQEIIDQIDDVISTE